jgi:hypothetical protein
MFHATPESLNSGSSSHIHGAASSTAKMPDNGSGSPASPAALSGTMAIAAMPASTYSPMTARHSVLICAPCS